MGDAFYFGMNYELAKKLKDNGFPFRTSTTDNGIKLAIPTSKKIIEYLDTKKDIINFDDEWFFIPTLSELIDACGDRFMALDSGRSIGERGWIAFSDDRKLSKMKTKGKTPKIAVAKLWLKLNKKSKNIKIGT